MAILEEATGTGDRPTLSAQELEVAKANLRFALENCPVDGGILIEDGGTTSEELVERLFKRLEAIEARSIGALDLDDEDIRVLKAVADYGIEECPVEGGMMLDDGRLVSKGDLRALRQRLDSLPRSAGSK